MTSSDQPALVLATLATFVYAILSSRVVAAFSGVDALPPVARGFVTKSWRGPLAQRAIFRALPSGILLVLFELLPLTLLVQPKSDPERWFAFVHYSFAAAWSAALLFYARHRGRSNV